MRKAEKLPLELKKLQWRSIKVLRAIIKVTTIHFFPPFSLSFHMIIAGWELVTCTHQANYTMTLRLKRRPGCDGKAGAHITATLK